MARRPASGTRQVVANDFAAQWQEIADDVREAVDRVGRSGWLVLGEEVRLFEEELASWWGVGHAVGVASGLDAIEIGLRCAGVRAGDRVLTTPLTAFATTLAVLRVGAEPVWCDVNESGSLDLDVAHAALSDDARIRALLPVHLYGHPLDPVRLRELCERHEVVLIEDCAQSAGARRGGASTGCAGNVAATSFYPTKNLGALGDGGALLTEDHEVAAWARVLRNYGQDVKYRHVARGMNSRLDEIHAAILRTALMPRLDGWLERRAKIASFYLDALSDSATLRPIVPTAGRSSNHLFPVQVVDGDPAGHAASLVDRGVQVGRHYPTLCSDQPACDGVGLPVGDLPVARRIADRELSLPIHPQLTDAAVENVVAACLELGE